MADFPLAGSSKMFSSGTGSTTNGTLVASSASANTMGSIVELDASTEYVASSIIVTLSGFSATGIVSFLFDIMIGAGGSEEVLIEGIHAESGASTSAQSVAVYEFPIKIPQGSRISARCQSDTAATDGVRLYVQLVSPTFSSPRGYGKCVSHGFDKVNTNGTAIDPGSVGSTKGSYVELATTSDGYNGFIISIGANQNDAQGNGTWYFDIAIGSAGNEEVIVPDIFHLGGSNEMVFSGALFYNINVPSGTRISARCQSSQTNSVDRVKTIVFHGVK